PRGYIAALKKRDPSGQLVVVIGVSHARSFVTAVERSSASRSSSDRGRRDRSGAGTRRAESSRNGALAVNGPRHQRSHRRVVRDGTPVVRVATADVAAAKATAAARIT